MLRGCLKSAYKGGGERGQGSDCRREAHPSTLTPDPRNHLCKHALRAVAVAVSLQVSFGIAGPAPMEEATIDTVLAAFRRFAERDAPVRVSATIEESGERTGRFSSRMTLKKPVSCRRDTFSVKGDLLEEAYTAARGVTTFHMPGKKRATIEDMLNDPLISFAPFSYPWGTGLFEEVLLSEDPEKTFRAMRHYYRLAGSETLAGVPCWVIESERTVTVARLPERPGIPREERLKTTFSFAEDGSVVMEKDGVQYRDILPGDEPHVACTSRIWIGKEDGIPRRSFHEQVSLEGNWGPVRMASDYAVETPCDAPAALFAFVPPAGTRVSDHTKAGQEARQGKTGLLTAGGPAPDFTMTTLDGKAFRLSDLKGKAVVIDFHNFAPG